MSPPTRFLVGSARTRACQDWFSSTTANGQVHDYPTPALCLDRLLDVEPTRDIEYVTCHVPGFFACQKQYRRCDVFDCS